MRILRSTGSNIVAHSHRYITFCSWNDKNQIEPKSKEAVVIQLSIPANNLSSKTHIISFREHNRRCRHKKLYIPGMCVGQAIVLHVCLVSGFSSNGHNVLGCWFSSIHLISRVLNPVSHDLEHCTKTHLHDIKASADVGMGTFKALIVFQETDPCIALWIKTGNESAEEQKKTFLFWKWWAISDDAWKWRWICTPLTSCLKFAVFVRGSHKYTAKS